MKNRLLLSSIILMLSSAHSMANEQQKEPLNEPEINQNVSLSNIDSNPISNESIAPKIPETTINCTYKIPPEITNVDLNVLKQWAEYAANQSFNLSYDNLDQDINQLKPCFTDQGFISFKDALQKSGNISAIKNQKLHVIGVKNGESSVEVLKTGQWNVTIPINVVYQNDQEKISQNLSVALLIERKSTGEFGIVQMNAKTKNDQVNNEINKNPSAPATTETPNQTATTPATQNTITTSAPETPNATPTTVPTTNATPTSPVTSTVTPNTTSTTPESVPATKSSTPTAPATAPITPNANQTTPANEPVTQTIPVSEPEKQTTPTLPTTKPISQNTPQTTPTNISTIPNTPQAQVDKKQVKPEQLSLQMCTKVCSSGLKFMQGVL